MTSVVNFQLEQRMLSLNESEYDDLVVSSFGVTEYFRVFDSDYEFA